MAGGVDGEKRLNTGGKNGEAGSVNFFVAFGLRFFPNLFLIYSWKRWCIARDGKKIFRRIASLWKSITRVL